MSYHLTISPNSDESRVVGYVGTAWELPENVKVATAVGESLEQCSTKLFKDLRERQDYLSRTGHLFEDLSAEERERWIRFGIAMDLRRVADADPLSSWSQDFYRAQGIDQPYWIDPMPEEEQGINWLAVFYGFLLALIPTILILLSFHAAGIL